MHNNILKKIKTLPPLDDTIVKIHEICIDQNSILNDLIKVTERDPMLTANILKSSNSPLYGFSKEIKNISHAIALFGMATIRGFALSSAIIQNFKIDLSPYKLTNEKFLKICIAQSALMRNWFTKVDRDMLDILVPASFMMELGKIIVANELIEQNMSEKFTKAFKKTKTIFEISTLEKEIVGFSNEEITAKVLEKWNLEKELVEAIKYSCCPEQANECVRPYATSLLVVKNSINIFGQLKDNSIATSLEILAKNDLNQEVFLDVITKMK
ncbi:MAG: HDOD domain-containing protein [Sulfurospirillum sp.]|nr:HDOD domain-containing protein [Sulfurospirillum sp.]MBL0703664.1 HDOD domain-containing protein [Sulfurospirillum sp.]